MLVKLSKFHKIYSDLQKKCWISDYICENFLELHRKVSENK